MPRDGSLQAIRKKLSKVAGNGNLESLAKERSAGLSEVEGRESLTDDSGRRRTTLDHLVPRNLDAESSALRKLQNGDFDDITPREQGYLEAIVEEDGRPVAFVIDDQFDTLLAPWTHQCSDSINRSHRGHFWGYSSAYRHRFCGWPEPDDDQPARC